jgi:hypothetical protein
MYLGYQNGKIKFYTEQPLNQEFYNLDEIVETQDEYVLDGDCYVLKDEAWEEKQKAKEAERIAQLNMTRGDFIEGLILALGKDENDVIALIETLPITDVEKKVYINRVKNALDFYRGYPVIDVLCGYLGLTTEQMTQFFETKDWKCLIPVVEEPEEPVEEPVEEENADSTDIQENTEA